METIPETTIPVVTEVIEAVTEAVDYVPAFQMLIQSNQNIEELLGYLVSFGLFAVIVCLCCFSYKFFKIFF